MKNLFQNMDLYKVIILASLVLLPVVGFWSYQLEGELDRGRTAIANATKSRGDLEEIGKFQAAVEKQLANRGSGDGVESHRIYFNKQIVKAAPRLKRSNFEITPLNTQSVGGRGRARAIDSSMSVIFKQGSKRMPLTRKELNAIIFNAESQSPVWKLRDLHIVNAGHQARANRAPALPLEDKWLVQTLSFTSRRPLGSAASTGSRD